MGNKDFERLQHIPDHLEGLTHKQDSAHAQGPPSKALHSQFWLTLTLHKQEINSKAELWPAWLSTGSVPQHRAPMCKKQGTTLSLNI